MSAAWMAVRGQGGDGRVLVGDTGVTKVSEAGCGTNWPCGPVTHRRPSELEHWWIGELKKETVAWRLPLLGRTASSDACTTAGGRTLQTARRRTCEDEYEHERERGSPGCRLAPTEGRGAIPTTEDPASGESATCRYGGQGNERPLQKDKRGGLITTADFVEDHGQSCCRQSWDLSTEHRVQKAQAPKTHRSTWCYRVDPWCYRVDLFRS